MSGRADDAVGFPNGAVCERCGDEEGSAFTEAADLDGPRCAATIAERDTNFLNSYLSDGWLSRRQ